MVDNANSISGPGAGFNRALANTQASQLRNNTSEPDRLELDATPSPKELDQQLNSRESRARTEAPSQPRSRGEAPPATAGGRSQALNLPIRAQNTAAEFDRVESISKSDQSVTEAVTQRESSQAKASAESQTGGNIDRFA